MPILVTGGTGFIGSHLVRELVERGEVVVTMSRNPDFSVLKSFDVDLDNVKVARGDVTDMASFLKTMKENDVDGIIHLASLLSVKTEAYPRLGFDVNVKGVFNVLEFARIMNIKRVVYGSSCSVYGPALYEPVDEEHPTNPEDLYGLTKLCGEVWGLNFSSLYNWDFTVLRLGTVYGPGQIVQPNHPMVVSLVEDAVFRKSVEWFGGEKQKLNTVYVKDAARGICLAYYSRDLTHKIFNISSGVQHTFQEIGKTLNESIPEAQINIGRDSINHEEIGLMDISRARKELLYKPRYSLKAGVKDYINWLQENEKWWRYRRSGTA